MKSALDAGVLGMLLFPSGPIPNDFRTGKPIEFARERVQALVESLDEDEDELLIPSPALAEALVPVANQMDVIIAEIESQRCFNISPFDKKAAIEVALRTKSALEGGDKKEGLLSPWQKVKYDRQIVAISKAEGASVLYSVDEDIHRHGKLWGIQVLSVADMPMPNTIGSQEELFEEESPKPHLVPEPKGQVNNTKGTESINLPAPDPMPGSAAGPITGEAVAQASNEEGGSLANGIIPSEEDLVNHQEEVTPKSETPAEVIPAGDAKSGS